MGCIFQGSAKSYLIPSEVEGRAMQLQNFHHRDTEGTEKKFFSVPSVSSWFVLKLSLPVDQHETYPCRLARAVGPGMVGAALDQNIACA